MAPRKTQKTAKAAGSKKDEQSTAASGSQASPRRATRASKGASAASSSPTKVNKKDSPKKRSNSRSPRKVAFSRINEDSDEAMEDPSGGNSTQGNATAQNSADKSPAKSSKPAILTLAMEKRVEHLGYVAEANRTEMVKIEDFLDTQKVTGATQDRFNAAWTRGMMRACKDREDGTLRLNDQEEQYERLPPRVDHSGVAADSGGRAKKSTKQPLRSQSQAPTATSSKSKSQTPASATKNKFEGHGNINTVTNPEKIVDDAGKNPRTNPFFEPMPGKLVWYSRMPKFLSFGETPYMEALASRQINEDLNRKHPETEAEKSKSEKAEPKPIIRLPSTWKLPEVTKQEISDAINGVKSTSARSPATAAKRGAQAQASASKAKKSRRG